MIVHYSLPSYSHCVLDRARKTDCSGEKFKGLELGFLGLELVYTFFHDNFILYFIGDLLKYSRSVILWLQVGIEWLDRWSPFFCALAHLWQKKSCDNLPI